MPRDREVTIGKVTPAQSHAAALKKAVKLHSPYAVMAGELVNHSEHPYAVVFTAPLGGVRYVVAGRNIKANANLLRDMLSVAWAEGHWASMRE